MKEQETEEIKHTLREKYKRTHAQRRTQTARGRTKYTNKGR